MIQELRAYLQAVPEQKIGGSGIRQGIEVVAVFREGLKSILKETFPKRVEHNEVRSGADVIPSQPDQVEPDLSSASPWVEPGALALIQKAGKSLQLCR